MTQAIQIIDRVAEVLLNKTDAGNRVFVHLESALEREESPAIVVEMVSEDPTPWVDGMDLNQFKFRLLFLARDENWQSALSTIRAQANALIFADVELNSFLLAGLHREKMEVQSASADLPIAVMNQMYSGQFVSRTNELHSFNNGEVAQ